MTTTTLEVKINDETIDALRTEIEFSRINEGHTSFIVLADNHNGQYNNYFDVDDLVEIYYNTLLVLKGKLDSPRHVVTQQEKWSGRDLLRIAGRDLSKEWSDLQLLKGYYIGTKIDDLIEDALIEKSSTISYTSGSTAPALDAVYTAEDEYLIDLVRNVLARGNPVWEGYVDPTSVLQLHGSPPDTGLTIAHALKKQWIEKQGLEIRNRLKVFGRANTFDPSNGDVYTEDALSNAYWTWYVNNGLIDIASGASKIGDKWIICTPEDMGTYLRGDFQLNRAFAVARGEYDFLRLWYCTANISTEIEQWYKLLVETETGSFNIDLPKAPSPINWRDFNKALGWGNTWDADDNPEGEWGVLINNPDWLRVTDLRFQFEIQLDTLDPDYHYMGIDGLYWYPKRVEAPWVGTGTKELTMIKDTLKSNSECIEYANRQLALLENPVRPINVTVPASQFISGGVWKGIPSHKLLLNFADLGISSQEYKLINLKLTVAPYENLLDGWDALATFDAIPIGDFHPWKNLEMIRTGRVSPILKR